MRTPPLPALPQSPSPRLRDGLSIIGWFARGHLHAVRRGPVEGRGRHLLLGILYALVLALPLFGLLYGLEMLAGFSLPQHLQGRPRWITGVAGLLLGALFIAAAGRHSIHGGDRRAYMTPTRQAFLSARRDSDGWHVENLFSRRPGTGQASHLWSTTIPALTEAADTLNVTLTANAINEIMAQKYVLQDPTFERDTTRELTPPAVPLIRHPRHG